MVETLVFPDPYGQPAGFTELDGVDVSVSVGLNLGRPEPSVRLVQVPGVLGPSVPKAPVDSAHCWRGQSGKWIGFTS